MIDPGVSVRLRDFYASRGMLLRMHMDILYACDLDCHHCYLDEKAKTKPVKIEHIINTLEQAAELGCMDLLLSGGEVFLRKDLFEIIEAARTRRFRVRLKSHGGRITKDDARRIAELQVSQVDFSVYAMDDEVHDHFTKKQGSLQRTLRGIDYVRKAGVEVEVKCSVTNLNATHYQVLYDYFEKRGIKATINAEIRGTNSGKLTTYPLNVKFDQKVQLSLFKIAADGALRNRPEPKPLHEAKLCYAGVTAIYVAPDLKVYPCSAFPMEVGDLTRQSLADIWNNAEGLKEIRPVTRANIQGCGNCSARKYCAYCMGAAYIENDGDYKNPAKLGCETAFAWEDATERYAGGERAIPLQPGQPQEKKVHFNITTELPGNQPKVSVCSNC